MLKNPTVLPKNQVKKFSVFYLFKKIFKSYLEFLSIL